MNNAEFAVFVSHHLARVQELVDNKNADYAGAGESAFSNFHEEAKALGLTEEQIWHVWAYKHWTAVTSYCAQGYVSSEPIEGRLHDIIGYSLLLLGIIEEKKEEVQAEERQRELHEQAQRLEADGVIVEP